MIRRLINDRKSYNHQIVIKPREMAVGVDKERVIQIVCESFCKHQNCNSTRDICISAGTCKNHDNFKNELKETLFK